MSALIVAVLAALALLAVLLLAPVDAAARQQQFGIAAAIGLILLALGAALLVLVLRTKPERPLFHWLVATAISALAIPVSAVLHNLVFALLTSLYGTDIGEEPVFFVIAVIVTPADLVVAGVFSQIRLARPVIH